MGLWLAMCRAKRVGVRQGHEASESPLHARASGKGAWGSGRCAWVGRSVCVGVMVGVCVPRTCSVFSKG